MKRFSKLLLLLVFISGATLVKAQEYLPGSVTLNDGSKVAGLILLDDYNPWSNQRRVYLKDSALIKANPDGKIKAKKYTVGDLKAFQVGTRLFERVHYFDAGNLQVKSLGANDHLLEKLNSGRINSWRYYAYPPDVDAYFAATEEEVRARERQKKHDLIAGYLILFSKDNSDKLHNAFDTDLLKFFNDTPEVLSKFQSGAYGNEPIVAKSGFAAKLMAMARKATFKQKEADAILDAFDEYNKLNAAKK